MGPVAAFVVIVAFLALCAWYVTRPRTVTCSRCRASTVQRPGEKNTIFCGRPDCPSAGL